MIRHIRTTICILIATFFAAFPVQIVAKTDALTGLECAETQTLWIYDAGNLNSLPSPENRDGGATLSQFQTWSTPDGDMAIAIFEGLPNDIKSGELVEFYVPRSSGESITLGNFVSDWPPNSSGYNAIGPQDGVAGTARPYPSGLYDAYLTQDGDSQYVGDFLASDAFKGRLVYYVPLATQPQYVRLSMCSNVDIEPEIPPALESVTSADPKPADPSGSSTEDQAADTATLAQTSVSDVQTLDDVDSKTLDSTLLEVQSYASIEAIPSAAYVSHINSQPEILDSIKLSIGEVKLFQTAFQTAASSFTDPTETTDLKLLLIGVGLTISVILLAIFLLFKKLALGGISSLTKAWPRPDAATLKRAENGGIIFPSSPMVAGNLAAPLAPAGQLSAANVQMLTGQYSVLRGAYNATGRIGYAQEGAPTHEDFSFGTGFLITPQHVATNRHVYGLYSHYLTGEDCAGIEFIAEKGKDASDFIAFDGAPPIVVNGLDLAIFKLSRPAPDRTPIQLASTDPEQSDDSKIIVIGYPDTRDVSNPDILAVVEDNPIFAVKRLSQGHIFRHSTDTDTPYGVQVNVDIDNKNSFGMDAICHNASTLTGNSGSPILDLKTGKLLGVHFAGYKVFQKKEAANLAMAVALLTAHEDIKSVTPRDRGHGKSSRANI